jgi:hypothetical protein
MLGQLRSGDRVKSQSLNGVNTPFNFSYRLSGSELMKHTVRLTEAGG